MKVDRWTSCQTTRIRQFAGNLRPATTKAQLVIQGQCCPDNVQRFVRTDAPTVHGTAVSEFLQIVSSMDWCRSLKGSGRVRCLSMRKIFQKLKSLCSLSGLPGIEKGALIKIVKGVFGMPDSPSGWWKELLDTLQGDVAPVEEAGETASSTSDQSRVLTIENEDARQSWHDEGRPDSFVSVIKDSNASRRRRASTSTSGRIVLKLGICGSSGDAWDPATAYLLTGSVDTANERFEAEVPSPAVGDMFGVSGGTSGSIMGTMRADPSLTTLRVEALSLGSLSTKLVLWASISSETECRPGQDANGSIAVHPAISEDFSGSP